MSLPRTNGSGLFFKKIALPPGRGKGRSSKPALEGDFKRDQVDLVDHDLNGFR